MPGACRKRTAVYHEDQSITWQLLHTVTRKCWWWWGGGKCCPTWCTIVMAGPFCSCRRPHGRDRRQQGATARGRACALGTWL